MQRLLEIKRGRKRRKRGWFHQDMKNAAETLYVEKNKSTREIALKLKCSERTVAGWRTRYRWNAERWKAKIEGDKTNEKEK